MTTSSFLQKLKSPVSLTIILIGMVLLFADYQFRWKEEKWKNAVHTDAADYYRYLPMIFVDHQFDGQDENPDVVKYFGGTAICYLPFFTVAYYSSIIAGIPADGYTILFPVMISIGTLFYLLFGFYYFSRLLRFFGIKEKIICTVLIALAFGTMTFHYTVMTPGWSHIVAFGLICYLLYHCKKLLETMNSGSIIAIISVSSLLFFVRPTDVLILLLVPFLANDRNQFFTTLKLVFTRKKAIAAGLLLAAIPVICQLIIYRWGTGEFLVYSYTKEGFNFAKPEIVNVLFSYAKGLFVYTPLCLLALFGLPVLFRGNRYRFWGMLLYMSVNTYVIASWWCWNYGASYGSRAFIEHYPVFFLLLAMLLSVKSKWIRFSSFSLTGLFIALNLIQTYQANTGILDYDFKTTKQGYWHVFLQTDKGNSGQFYRFPADERPENIVTRTVFYNAMELVDSTWINNATRTTEQAHSGKYSSKVNKSAAFSVGKYIEWNQIPYRRNVLIRASGWFFIPAKGTNAFLAISFVGDDKSINFTPYALDSYTQRFGKWEYHVFELQMPKLFKNQEKQEVKKRVECYLYNDSDKSCYVDDLKIEFIEFRNMERPLDLSWE